jgi:hypothetical protein
VRVGVEPAHGRRDLYEVEQIERTPAGCRPRDAMMHAHGLGDQPPDGEGGIERSRRLLKDHRH